jgi:hypothetical protein
VLNFVRADRLAGRSGNATLCNALNRAYELTVREVDLKVFHHVRSRRGMRLRLTLSLTN